MKLVRLGKIAKVDRMAATPNECEVLPYVGLDDIEKDRGRFTDEFRHKPEKLLAAKFKFSPRHVLYGKLRPYLNKVALPHFVGVCTTEILPLLPNESVLERGYLFALLLSPKFVAWASQNVSGANLPRLDPKLLIDYETPLPPLPEQKRIAAILEKAHRLRRTRHYAHQLSDTFLQSVFIEMFGDILKAETKLVLSDILEKPLSNGSFEKDQAYGSGAPVVWVDNLYHTITIDLTNLRRARLSEDALEKYQVLEGDLLFTRSSLVREGIGQVNIVPTLPEKTAFECHIIRARVDRKKVDPFYVLGLYRSSYGRGFITRRANTATMTTISQTAIEELPCPVPPLSLQQKFAAIVRRFERLLAQQWEAEHQAEHLFQSLLHRAFGEGGL